MRLRGAQDYLTWNQVSAGLLDRALQHAVVRTQADRRLRRSEQQLREAQAAGRVGSWEWDIASGSVVWSDEMYRVFALDPARFSPTYEGFLSLVAAEERHRVRAIVDGAAAERRPFVFETRVVRGDGEVCHLYGRGDVILDSGGRLVRMVGIGQDISERKRAEEQREAALARLQAILHDEVGQLLTALKVMMESRRRPRGKGGARDPRQPRDPLRSRWPQMNAIVSDLMTRVRDLSRQVTSPVTIVLGDDHQVVRQGLRLLLQSEPDFQAVGEESAALKIADPVQRLKPRILVVDLGLPGINGLEVTRQSCAAPRAPGWWSFRCMRPTPTSWRPSATVRPPTS